MSGRRLRSAENNENVCPLTRKRVKGTATLDTLRNRKNIQVTLNDNNSTKSEGMGMGMLESDESSSSASAIALAVSASGSADENSNEATPNLDAAKFSHHILQYQQQNRNYSIETLDSSTDNASFIEPSEPIKTTLSSSNSNNITYNCNNNCSSIMSNLREERRESVDKIPQIPQRKVAILGIGAGLISSTTHSPADSSQNSNKCRSPLATVACNNNYKSESNIHEIQPNTVVLEDNHHSNINQPPSTTIRSKQFFVPDENFFLYRNQTLLRQSTNIEDYFKKISDEIILQVFKWLPKKTLIRCSYVCQRFNRCARDESLWARLDLGSRSLRPGAFSYILPRGIVILRLAQSELKHPVFEPQFLQMYVDYRTKLQYLDLSMAAITKPSLKMLLSRCRQLKKLSLEHVPVNDEICDEIAKNINLEALNLAMCTGLEAWSVRKMLTELQGLNSLNISWTNLTVDAVSAVVTNVTSNLMRLNLSGCRKTMFDSHLATLSKRCGQLLELDLSDCTGLTSSAISVVCKFKMLEYLSLSRCYLISASSYIELKKLPTLTYLDVFGILSDTALETLEKSFPSLGINKFIHSSVARPTVGTRRTSIWGLRTRD